MGSFPHTCPGKACAICAWVERAKIGRCTCELCCERAKAWDMLGGTQDGAGNTAPASLTTPRATRRRGGMATPIVPDGPQGVSGAR